MLWLFLYGRAFSILCNKAFTFPKTIQLVVSTHTIFIVFQSKKIFLLMKTLFCSFFTGLIMPLMRMQIMNWYTGEAIISLTNSNFSVICENANHSLSNILITLCHISDTQQSRLLTQFSAKEWQHVLHMVRRAVEKLM